MKYDIEMEQYGKKLPAEGGHGEPVEWKKVGEGEVYIGLEKSKCPADKWFPNGRIEDSWLFVCVKDKHGKVFSIHEEELE